jgi:hypothetical protein
MSGLPPNRSPEAIPTHIENPTASDGSPVEIIDCYQFVMGHYFEAMGVQIVAGRSFEPADALTWQGCHCQRKAGEQALERVQPDRAASAAQPQCGDWLWR